MVMVTEINYKFEDIPYLSSNHMDDVKDIEKFDNSVLTE